MRTSNLFTIPALFLTAALASAQSFNLDVGDNLILWPLPSSTHGAAAGQPGVWNNIKTPYSWTLNDLAGAATSATCTSTVPNSYNHFPITFTGDDNALMEDIQSISPGATAVWTFSGLANGNYRVYTYAWAPDNATLLTSVDIPASTDALQIVGGAWGGSPHVQGITYALHHVLVTSGTIVLNASGQPTHSGSINGFQLVFDGNGCTCASAFCAGDGSGGGVPCPCANNGVLGHGCDNSAPTGGALLDTTGSASPDTVVLHCSGTLPTSLSIFLQGTTTIAPVTFGDGTRCIGGSLKRLYSHNAVGGVVSAPVGADAPITTQSANLGDPIAPGSQRFYQTYYRDPNPTFCMLGTSTFNVSSAVAITWP